MSKKNTLQNLNLKEKKSFGVGVRVGGGGRGGVGFVGGGKERKKEAGGGGGWRKKKKNQRLKQWGKDHG